MNIEICYCSFTRQEMRQHVVFGKNRHMVIHHANFEYDGINGLYEFMKKKKYFETKTHN